MNWYKILKLTLLSLAISCHNAQAEVDITIEPSVDGIGRPASIKIKSDNLFMRNVGPGDLDYFREMFTNPVTMEKYMQGIPRPTDEVCRRHQKYLEWWSSGNPFTSYIVYLEGETARAFLEDPKRDSPLPESFLREFEASGKIFIGHVLLEEGDRDIPNEAEVSYVFRPESWRRGYGAEAVENIVKLAGVFRTEGMTLNGHSIDTLIATARPDNPGSCGVLEKNGFEIEKEEEKFGAQRRLYTKRL